MPLGAYLWIYLAVASFGLGLTCRLGSRTLVFSDISYEEQTNNMKMLKALIVDDEEDIGLMVSRFLQKEGVETEFVTRIGAAEDRIDQSTFDIYFLDLNLPDGTGFDLMPKIRAQNPDARIVVISAYDGHAEIRRSAEMEVDEFIKKPFTKSQVIEAVRLLT